MHDIFIPSITNHSLCKGGHKYVIHAQLSDQLDDETSPFLLVDHGMSTNHGRDFKKKSKIGHVVIVVHFMYDLPVLMIRSRECRIWVDSG